MLTPEYNRRRGIVVKKNCNAPTQIVYAAYLVSKGVLK